MNDSERSEQTKNTLALEFLKLMHARRDYILQRIVKNGTVKNMGQDRPKHEDHTWVLKRLSGHLTGGVRIGLKLVWFGKKTFVCILDLDAHGENDRDRMEDALRLLELFKRKGFKGYLERSKNGFGVHLWFFFAQPVLVDLWREKAKQIIEEAGIEFGQGEAEALPSSGDRGTCPFTPYYNRREAERTGLTAFLDPLSLRPLSLAWFLDHVELNPASLLRPPRKRRRTIFDRLRTAGISIRPRRSLASLPVGPFLPKTRYPQIGRAAWILATDGGTFSDLLAWFYANCVNSVDPYTEADLRAIWKSKINRQSKGA